MVGAELEFEDLARGISGRDFFLLARGMPCWRQVPLDAECIV